MARLRPQLTPAGEPERRLYEAATAKFDPLALFFAAVAKRSGNEVASEKGAFFRYVRGKSIPPSRLVIYGMVLDADPATFARPTQPAVPTDDFKAVWATLDDLKAQVAKIQRRLDEDQGPPRSAASTP